MSKPCGRVMSLVFAAVLGAGGVAWAQDADTIERGIEVYAAQRCALCHSIAGTGNRKGPLDGVGVELGADAVRRWVVSPREMEAEAGSTRKPPMRPYPDMPDDELEALVAYILSVPSS